MPRKRYKPRKRSLRSCVGWRSGFAGEQYVEEELQRREQWRWPTPFMAPPKSALRRRSREGRHELHKTGLERWHRWMNEPGT